MRFVTADTMRRLDRLAIETHGIPGAVLMERAGTAVADAALELLSSRVSGRFVLVLAGRGNNGGDGFVAARLLKEQGLRVSVWSCAAPGSLRGDALSVFESMREAAVPFEVLDTMESWTTPNRNMRADGGIVVDALLGTGAMGAPRGVLGAAVRWAVNAAARASVLAVDMPSGIDADSGEAAGDAVRADLTVTFGHPKSGMRSRAGRAACGSIMVADIGLPQLPEGWADGADAAIDAPGLRCVLPRRDAEAHKGCYGRVLVVGGSRGFGGAPALTALAALRAGAGLVSAVVPEGADAALAARAPEVMTHALATSEGRLGMTSWRRWGRSCADFDLLAVGPGLGVSPMTRELVEHLLGTARKLVLDADALSVWRGNGRALKPFGERLVLTPHPGEAAGLLNCDAARVQEDRVNAVRRLVDITGAVVVLKGAGTLVAAPGMEPRLNLNGNPGMATAGSGDVLTGLIAGLMAQGITPVNAAMTGVYLHGAAGDHAAWARSPTALIAGDILEALPAALRTLSF